MKILRFVLYGLLLLLVGIAGFIIGALTLGDYSPNMLLELVSGETPQVKITRYLQAIEAQDRSCCSGCLGASTGQGRYLCPVKRTPQLGDR